MNTPKFGHQDVTVLNSPYKCDHEIILMVDTRDIYTNLLMDKLCMDVISIPVKNYIIASIGILNCELL